MRQLISSRPDAKLLFSFFALSTSLAVFLCKCRRKEKRSKETPFSGGNFLKKVSSGLLQKLFDNYSREVKAGNPATVAGMSGVHSGGTFLSLPCVRGGAALPRGGGVVPNTNYPPNSFKNFWATAAGAFGVHSGGTFPILFSKVFAGVRGRLLQKAPPARPHRALTSGTATPPPLFCIPSRLLRCGHNSTQADQTPAPLSDARCG